MMTQDSEDWWDSYTEERIWDCAQTGQWRTAQVMVGTIRDAERRALVLARLQADEAAGAGTAPAA